MIKKWLEWRIEWKDSLHDLTLCAEVCTYDMFMELLVRILYLNAKIESCGLKWMIMKKVFHRKDMLYSSSQVEKLRLSTVIQQTVLFIWVLNATLASLILSILLYISLLCSVMNLDDLTRRGLYLSDIPLHDATRDLVLLGEQFREEYKLTQELEILTDRLQHTLRALEDEKKKTDT